MSRWTPPRAPLLAPPRVRVTRAHTVAILLHDCCAVYDPLSTSLLYAIHYTILIIMTSWKRQPLLRMDVETDSAQAGTLGAAEEGLRGLGLTRRAGLRVHP